MILNWVTRLLPPPRRISVAGGSPFDPVSLVYDVVMGWCFDHYTRSAALIARVAGSLEGKVLVDLGGGTGGLASRLASLGAHAIVLDRSRALTRRAQQRVPGAVTGSAVDLPFGRHVADIAVMCQVLHHLDSPAAALAAVKEAERVLRPGGQLVILEMDPPSTLGTQIHIWLEQLCFGRIWCWSRDALVAALVREGFHVRRPESVGFVLVAHKPAPAVAHADVPLPPAVPVRSTKSESRSGRRRTGRAPAKATV